MKQLRRVLLILLTVLMLTSVVSALAVDSPTLQPTKEFIVGLSKVSTTYNGKVQKPTVYVFAPNGQKLSTTYYTIAYNKDPKSVGKYTITITGKGKYAGYKKTMAYTIKKATQTIKVTPSYKTLKYTDVKKATKSYAYTLTKKAGTVVWNSSKTGVYVKNGKVYVKKGTPKGTYTIKFKVTNWNYNDAYKTIKIVVK